MPQLLFLFIILCSFFSSQKIYAAANDFQCLRSCESDDCWISFVECANEQFVVKQIKDSSPDEQFLLVLDALGCHIAENSAIPINKITVIPPKIAFPGKMKCEFPATLHTQAIGVSVEEQESCYQEIDVQQRFRKKNSPMSQRWGPLPQDKAGLTLTVTQNMAKHPDLPKIVALDTFVGNADRSPPNLFYDAITDRFCGIDMAASFSSPLAAIACWQLKRMKREDLTTNELAALNDYASTLKDLINNWPPEKQEQLLLEYSEKGGFTKGSALWDQNIIDRIEFHKKYMDDNYQNCVKLVEIIKLLRDSGM